MQVMAVLEHFNQVVVSARAGNEEPDLHRRLSNFQEQAKRQFGEFGLSVAKRLRDGLYEETFSQPMNLFRDIDWKRQGPATRGFRFGVPDCRIRYLYRSTLYRLSASEFQRN